MKSPRATWMFVTVMVLGLLASPFAAEAKKSRSQAKSEQAVEEWTSRLRVLDELARQEKWQELLPEAERAVDEILGKIVGGSGAGQVLGMAVYERAIAEIGLGETEDGLWDWYVAQSLDPRIQRFDLGAYGEVGSMLSNHRIDPKRREASTEKPADEAKSESSQVSRPEILKKTIPEFPRGMRVICGEGRVVIESMIDEQGRVTEPSVLEAPGGPLFLFAAFEAIREWRFKPAMFEGKPVKVFYVLSVNFDTRGCR